MTTKAPQLPLKSKPNETGSELEQTNLYLPRVEKPIWAATAKSRYGFSLSELVRELLKREETTKGGILRAKFATRS